MPEGDTIHRAARTLARALAGRTVTHFESGYAHIAGADDQAPIVGRRVTDVRAHGKHLLIGFSGPASAPEAHLTLRTHMRMNGSWHVYRPGERWSRPRTDLRILIEVAPLEPGAPGSAGEAFVAAAFSVPVAELLSDAGLARAPALRRLGPDLLADDFDPAEALRRLRGKPDQPLSEVPLDQSVAAGAGNVYRSEALFLCRLDPTRRASSVADAELVALFTLTRKLLRANVANGVSAGATGQIVTYTGLRRTTGRADPGERLWVYGRGGKPCRRCGTPIAYRKTGPDARGLYFCPRCQR